jgi:arylsulfatase A-like enzyme
MGLGYAWKKIVPSLDVSVHGVGHGAGGAAATQDKFISFLSEQVAGIITRLEAVREGNGTVMDNTVIMLTSDNAEQHHARGWRWPVMLIGSGGGKLAANGRYIRYPTRSSNMNRVPTGAADNQRALGDLFSALSHVFDHPVDNWGKDGLEKARGPLAEILA